MSQSSSLATPKEIMEIVGEIGYKRTHRRTLALFLVGIQGGIFIAFACAATSTAVYAMSDPGLVRMITALIFPFGLATVVMTGGELFTGNCMIPIAIIQKKATFLGMLRNWVLVYSGNVVGSLLVAWGYCATHLPGSTYGTLAVYMMQVAGGKMSLTFWDCVISSAFCNILVTAGVLLAIGTKDLVGKFMACFFPVALFVMSGFENMVANMYYIPAGIMVAKVPHFAEVAAESGLDISHLTYMSFAIEHLIPVTIGSLIGGVGLGLTIWYCNLGKGGDLIDGSGNH